MFVLFGFISYSQISVSQSKTIGVIKNGSDEDIVLTMAGKNITLVYLGIDEDKNWNKEVIKFVGDENDLNTLYKAFMSVFDPENRDNKNYSLELTLGTDVVKIENKKLFGTPYLVFGNGKIHTRQLTKNQIETLFNKK
jgi:hypothetical protein